MSPVDRDFPGDLSLTTTASDVRDSNRALAIRQSNCRRHRALRKPYVGIEVGVGGSGGRIFPSGTDRLRCPLDSAEIPAERPII